MKAETAAIARWKVFQELLKTYGISLVGVAVAKGFLNWDANAAPIVFFALVFGLLFNAAAVYIAPKGEKS